MSDEMYAAGGLIPGDPIPYTPTIGEHVYRANGEILRWDGDQWVLLPGQNWRAGVNPPGGMTSNRTY